MICLTNFRCGMRRFRYPPHQCERFILSLFSTTCCVFSATYIYIYVWWWSSITPIGESNDLFANRIQPNLNSRLHHTCEEISSAFEFCSNIYHHTVWRVLIVCTAGNAHMGGSEGVYRRRWMPLLFVGGDL